MSNKTRDDFYAKDKKILALRSAYRCNNPGCRRMTVMAHSDVNQYISIGQACHIAAAAPGGKRYNPDMTAKQRSSASENGIWLCFACGKLIDSDEKTFTAELLKQWKHDAERETLSGNVTLPSKNDRRILAVANVAGGVGKSFCTAMICYCLAKYENKKVLCISASDSNHALLLLGADENRFNRDLLSICDMAYTLTDIQENLIPVQNGIDCMEFNLLETVNRTNFLYSGSYCLEKMIRNQMEYGNYDYAVCDCGRGDPGVERCLLGISTDVIVPVGDRVRIDTTVNFLARALQDDRLYSIFFLYSTGRNSFIDKKSMFQGEETITQAVASLNQRSNITAKIAHEIIPCNWEVGGLGQEAGLDHKKIGNVRSAYRRMIEDELM